jgi:hypothetical protein
LSKVQYREYSAIVLQPDRPMIHHRAERAKGGKPPWNSPLEWAWPFQPGDLSPGEGFALAVERILEDIADSRYRAECELSVIVFISACTFARSRGFVKPEPRIDQYLPGCAFRGGPFATLLADKGQGSGRAQ